VTDIEITQPKDRTLRYRLFEMLPGVLSWSLLSLPFILSMYSAELAAIFIIAYIILWFLRAIALNFRVLQGYGRMVRHQKIDWISLGKDLERGAGNRSNGHKLLPFDQKWHSANVAYVKTQPDASVRPSEVIHAAIIAVYKETIDIVKPTIEAVLASSVGGKKIMVFIAFEERGGAAPATMVKELTRTYQSEFLHFEAVMHPKDIPGEIIGKGGNITCAGKRLHEYVREQGIDQNAVVITTLDSDNRPHKSYFACLEYLYAACPTRDEVSYQPIPMFVNNIWDAPAPMRVIATGNSFWMFIQVLRPHILRNFAAHAQSLNALEKTNFWSTRTIVEDGHQFWRAYFAYDGRHEVVPIFLPNYQDAVLVDGYRRTLKAQFIQLRRWAWGASDIAYVAEKAFFTKNKLPKFDVWMKFLRLLEGHVSWATSSIILSFGAFLPLYVSENGHRNYLASQLPEIVAGVQRVAMLGLAATMYLCLKTLPPKPARYRKHRRLFMVIQWVYLPLTSIFYGSAAALTSQTRLIFGKYLDKFDFTEKVVKK
jgi:Glycosyl transferase family group 2